MRNLPGERPETVAECFADAWNRHDMRAFAALFRDDADFVNVIGLHWRGRADIERAHVELHRVRMRASRLTLGSVSARLLRPDVAIVHGTWRLDGDTGLDGVALPPRHGILSLLATDEGDGWRVDAAQNTDIVALPNTPP